MEFLMDTVRVLGFILVFLVCFGIYIMPGVIAYKRDHHYKWPIIAMNFFFGVTALGWLAALIWAVWPRETLATNVITHDPVTGKKL